ncbi:cytochrome C biogenesis protein ResC [Bowdeniella nasicola]|uniref:Cytochrome C biogenesis protein ResC n=1 Tax=Bowdeniella nasicola TaxID=208480 RepID=A0A1Q5Q273_9ACTO|nr:cytochrome c biogenesis protein CcdA [Bowdeniella nasicola]OKL53941.1 cytochrome C biogenesis protein ResC [Bowdeniella nasicola]
MDLVEFFRSTVLTGSMLAALPVALIAGLVSFASPCVLPLLPGYVGYVSGMAGAAVEAGGTKRKAPTRKVVGGLSLFVLGFTTVFVGLGIAFASLGYALAPYLSLITRILGVLVILLGLAFAGWLPFAQTERRLRVDLASGQVGAFVLGLVFGFGWTPCIGPTLSAVLTLALDGANPWRGAFLALAYCLGLGIPFIVLGALFTRSTAMLTALRRHRVAFMRIGGIVLIALGILLVSGLWDSVTAWLQGLIGGFETVV